jgi:predicted permease
VPDWRARVRERLAPLRLDPHRELELADELGQELEERYARAIREGLSPEDAAALAARELDDESLTKEIGRAIAPPRTAVEMPAAPAPGTGGRIMSGFLQDVRYGVRLLSRNPGFTATAVLSLALGLGANATLFAVVNQLLLNPLNVPDPSRLVSIFTTDANNTDQLQNFMPVSYPNYLDHRDRNPALGGAAAVTFAPISLSSGGEPEQITGQLVTGNYFDLLGIRAAHGRLFSYSAEEDKQLDAHAVVVLSHALWTRRFGASPAVVETPIQINRRNYVVRGVAPADFRGVNAIGGPDVWIPLSMRGHLLTGFIGENFNDRRALVTAVFGRLRPGASVAEADAAARAIGRDLEQAYPADNASRSAIVRPINDATFFSPEIRDNIVTGGAVLMGVVGLVLLIACANVANLLLARAAARKREIAVRISLGAGSGRLVRQLLTESVLLALLAGGLGLLMAVSSRDLLWALRPPFLQDGGFALAVGGPVVAFTAGLSLVTGVLFGLFPAWQLSRPNLAVALKDRANQPSRANRLRSVRNVLVMAQVAFSLMALVAAGLFLRSVQNAQQIDPGFETRRLLMLSFDTGAEGYSDARAAELHRQVLEKMGELPMVERAALANSQPFGGTFSRTVFPEGADMMDRRNGKLTQLSHVTPGYFETVGTPVIRGRGFTETDRDGAPMVALINETMARQMWPGQDPIGARFRCFGENWIVEIVGIVADAKYTTIGEPPQRYFYFPLAQHPSPFVTLHVRTRGEPDGAIGAVRGAVQAFDPAMPLINVMTIAGVLDQGLWAPRMAARLLGGFGLLALVLACIGLHGVISYSVVQRTQEISIRMALGARPADVLRMVLSQTALIVAIGTAAGLAGAYAAARAAGNLLFDVGSADPLTYAATAGLLLAVAMLASYLPARRAARIDPMAAPRGE